MNRGQPHHSELPSDYEPFETEESGPEVRELLRRLWGYKWLIAVIMALGVGGTWVTVQQLVPRYTATTVIMIEPPKKNVIDLQEVVRGLDTRPQTIRSEVVVIQSRELATKAVQSEKTSSEARQGMTSERSISNSGFVAVQCASAGLLPVHPKRYEEFPDRRQKRLKAISAAMIKADVIDEVSRVLQIPRQEAAAVVG